GMGWMRETRDYLRVDPLWRKHHHGKLTFPATYSFNERYMLAVSHDEVAHGGGSLMERSFGTYDQKFASTRAFFLYMMTHPGKKLLFMGSEIGQFAEWDAEKSVEWFLLDYEKHARFQLYMAELNRLYLQYPALWDGDDRAESFRLIDGENAEQNVYAYRRVDRKGEELVVVLNFCPVRRERFLLSVPKEGIYEEIFNSDGIRYGGEGGVNPGKRGTCRRERNGYGYAVDITLPAMGGTVFRLRK
ncbi:MAG: alpha amylase C-terminal domain-containing protein, partial [Clostridia bacterium]|nr:alpha amylase C-terminal domain-containing protein [Clostridia bacterium]